MRHIFPVLNWLPTYKKDWFLKDLVAGLTVGVILIPQGMAYAMIAGLPPVYGLYASLLPVLMYIFFGTSRQLAVGPVAMDSLLVAVGLGMLSLTTVENYIAMAIFLAFLVGVIQLLLGVCRMGFLVNFLSKPVINGFTSAAAIIIVFSQVKHLLGVEVARSTKFHELVGNVFAKLSQTNPYDFAIGITGILLIMGLKKWSKKIPAVLVAVAVGILAVYFFNLEYYGVEIVGEVPKGLPSFKIPNISLDNALSVWPIALTLALVGFLETIAIGKGLEEKEGKETIVANQELVALGVSNILGSFFQSYPVTSSFSRSAINASTGAKTNLAALFSVILVLLTLLFFTPLFYFMPNAVLASIIMVSVVGLVDFGYAKNLWKNNRDELFVFLVAFLITLFVGIPQGILVGVLFSLLLMVYRTSNPHFAVLENVRNTNYYKNISRFSGEVTLREDLLIIRLMPSFILGIVVSLRGSCLTK